MSATRTARVALLAPVDNSPYSRLILQRCLDEPGVEVVGVAVRRILNPARLRSELKRDGARLLRKAWRKLVLGGRDAETEGELGFAELAELAGVGGERVTGLARRHGVECLRVHDHNDPEVIDLLRRRAPDVVAFTGGGIIRKGVLEAAGRGIFNAHMGLLPEYRGMDVVEWPFLEGRDRDVGLGVSLHFMARGIDLGPIAFVERIEVAPGDTVERLRKRFEPVIADLMMRGIRAVRDGSLELSPQREEEGRQYFVLHPRLYQRVRECVAARAREAARSASETIRGHPDDSVRAGGGERRRAE